MITKQIKADKNEGIQHCTSSDVCLEADLQKLYLSGPITGIEGESAILFSAAEQYFAQKGFQVVNPFKLNHNHGKTWEEYMAVDILAMLDCGYVCMLPGWERSQGARLEHAIAHERGLCVFYWNPRGIIKPVHFAPGEADYM